MRKQRGGRSGDCYFSPSQGANVIAPCTSGIRLLGWIYLVSAIGGISQTAAFQCPLDHYQYPSDACSSCFTIVNEPEDFMSAQSRCNLLGGKLTTTEDETNFELLSRYLGGLNESRRLWIGYRYSSSGSKIGLEGNEAPGVVQDNSNFNGSTTGNINSCIGIQNGKFILAPCTDTLSFICTIVYSAPSAVKQPNVNIVYEAQSQDSIQLQADVTGNGIKFVEWKFNGTGIRNGPGITVSVISQVSTGLIAILTVSSYDPVVHLGTYELLVTSQAGTASVASWLLRNAVIDLTVMPRDLLIPEGQLAALECYGAESKPRPNVMWYKNSTQITNGTDPRVFVSELSGTLFIRDVQSLDTGMYHCVVTNIAGSRTSRKASLTVLSPGADFQPQFILQPRLSMTVLTGEPYSIECTAAHRVLQPALIVSVHDVDDVSAGSVYTYRYPDNQGFPIYRIESATFQEPECYYCATRSDPYTPHLIFGSQKSYITVRAAAQVERLSIIRTGMRTEDNFQSIPLGDSAVLECEFSGIPAPNTVDWTRDGYSITNGIVQTSNTSSLTISSLSRSGIYQCHVENMYGKNSQSVFLLAVEQEDGVPGPVPFTAEPDTNTSIYISWGQATPPRTHPLLLRYEILFRDTTNDVNSTFGPFISSQANYTITGLEPYAEYLVSMVATSLQGRSNATSRSATTFPNSPTQMINNITVERNDNNTFLIIQWEPYLTPGGREVPTATYDIEYREVGSGSSVMSRRVYNTPGIIGGLTNAENYEVRVRVTIQIVRNPPQFASSEWSEYIRVHGITTLPTVPTPPQTKGITPAERGGLSSMGLLLLIIFVVIGVILIIVVVLSAIAVVYWLKKPGGKYSVQDRRRKKRKGPQTPMRDEVFNISTSLPTSPSTSPPPLSISNQLGGGSRHSSSILGSRSSEKERGSSTVSAAGTDLGGVPMKNQENGGVCGVQNGGSSDGPLPVNVSNQSLQRSGSTSPQPLPPPIAEVDNSYTTMHMNLYTMEPFTNHDPHIVISPPPPGSSLNVGFTDQVHDIPTDHFQKLALSDEMPFEGGSPEVFDRLEGFAEEPVRTMATFDIITTGGTEAGSCDTLTRDGIDSRNDTDSPATMSSLVNQTPEPQADHRVTFAPAVITISPVPHVNQELSNAIMELNSSNCNNSERFFASDLPDVFNHQLPPVAEIVEGKELSDQLQLEPASTSTL